MAEPTEADRERAREIRQRLHQTLSWPRQDELLAQALADERERARAPFLALATGDEADAVIARKHEKAAKVIGEQNYWHSLAGVREQSARRVRRAAEETGQ